MLVIALSDSSEEENRPTRCVYMSNMAENLDDQSWLDIDSLEQVLKPLMHQSQQKSSAFLLC